MKFIEIALQLLFFMFCTSALGEPWRMLIQKFTGLFKGLDFLRALLLDVYLGGFLLYVIAIIPLHFFNAVVLYIITLVSIVTVVLLHRRRVKDILLPVFSHPGSLLKKRPSLELAIILAILASSLVIQTYPLNDLVLGSVRDTAIHSLFVEVLIENRQVPLTLEPYLSEGIIYPQGFPPMVAYSMLLLNYSPPQAVLYVTSLFNVLTVLGAYFLGEALSLSRKWRLSLSLVFVFAFVASWPKYITWGSNALVASLPLYLVCLSTFPLLVKGKLDFKLVLTIGLLFGYLSVLHLEVFETLITSLFVLWLYLMVKKAKDRWLRLGYFAAITSVSLLVLSPFLLRQFAFYGNPFHNIGVPADVRVPLPQPSLTIVSMTAKWLLENLAVDPILKACSFVLIFISILTIVLTRKKDHDVQTIELLRLAVATFIAQLLIPLFAAISPGDIPFYPQPLLLYISIYFLIAAIAYSLYHHFSSLSKRILRRVSRSEPRAEKFAVTSISVMLFVALFGPFLYQSAVFDPWRLYGSYAVFGVTTQQDLQLISWIGNNLPLNATILIDNFQAGTFLPSLANRKAVFPSFGSSTSSSYQSLVALLEQNILNATTLNLMRRFNITDIYVGSGISPWDSYIHRFAPELFLGNPQFTLMKNFGSAYLFHCNYVNTSVVFLDDFEHADWDQNGWQTQYAGNGLGNVMITSDFGYNSQRSLRMTAQAVYMVTEWRYARSVSREIFVPDNSDVTFSFYLGAVEGFHEKDTFAVVISNVNRNQSMIVTTPNGVYGGYRNARTLSGFEGLFSDALSSSWKEFFNATLPNTLVLEFVNWDFDGIENVAYVDDISIAAMPIT